MIEFLKISSMAVFEEASIDFSEGLNSITGETGAGKSLIIGALTLLMGAKAGSDIVRSGKEKAVVEALFSVSGQELVLKREIFRTGRSRCYINGELSTSDRLAEVSAGLIHIYGQHQYQDLLVPREHMRILEDLASLKRAQVQAAYETFQQAHDNLKDIQTRIEQVRKEKDDILFCLQELRAASIHEGEEDQVNTELDVAHAALALRQSAMEAYDVLYADNSSIMDRLSTTKTALQRMTQHDPRVSPYLENIETITAQVDDMARSLRALSEEYEHDPERIESLEARLFLIRDLKRKYAVDESGLNSLQSDLEKKLALIEDSSAAVGEAQEQLKTAQADYLVEIRNFLKQREDFAQEFSQKINNDLASLGMPGTRFTVQQMKLNELNALPANRDLELLSPSRLLNGEFMISTNVGLAVLPLAKIASGGELSRIMLAIKVQQHTSQDATMIFDEIDAGIGGQTAFMIADKLRTIAAHSQTIVITHLAQVAAGANTHQVINKEVRTDQTISTILPVSGSQRVMEIARMLGGEKPSANVIKHAKELVGDKV